MGGGREMCVKYRRLPGKTGVLTGMAVSKCLGDVCVST